MHIAILNQYFYPESTGTAPFVTDLACSLADRGHTVSVVCAGTPYRCEPSGSGAVSVPRLAGVQVYRAPSIRFRRGALGRVTSYAVFFFWAAWWSLRINRPDVAITLTTPPALSILGAFMKAVRGTRHFTWEMDLYPDVLADLRYVGARSWIVRLLGLILDYPRRRADGIIALGECMRGRLLRRGIPSERVHVAENWADARHIRALPFGCDGPLTVLYSGNLGMAHDTETIETALDELRSDEEIRFVFAGGGPCRPKLEKFCSERQISNVAFRSYASRDNLSESLAEGDIGLVTQRDGSAGSVVPSKVYGIMAAGRPILFVGPSDATPARIIRRLQCGWHVECGQWERLAELLRHLAANRDLILQAGERARRGFEEKYDLPIGVGRIASILGLAVS